MTEEWKQVDEIQFLEVSSLGRVRNKDTGTIYKPRFKEEGYEMLELRLPIHRLVAKAFIPNLDPNNKTQVDHIVPVKPGACNNSVSNLQWVTQAENNAKRVWKAGASGEKYISWNKANNRFQVRYNGQQSLHKTLQEAVEARNKYLATV